LEAIDPVDQRRLAGLARLLARGTGDEGCDLLQSAIVRWLQASSEEMPTPKAAYAFIRDAMFSVRSNRFRQLGRQRSELGGRLAQATADAMDPVENVCDRTASVEDQAFAQQVYDKLADDEELLAYLMGRFEHASRSTIKSDNKWDDNRYDAVQKRFRRMMLKLQSEGALQ
jgi:hypothetical protein